MNLFTQISSFGRPVAVDELVAVMAGSATASAVKAELSRLYRDGLVEPTTEWSKTPWAKMEVQPTGAAPPAPVALNFEVPSLETVQSLVMVSFDEGEPAPSSIYDEDDYLRRLAAEQTPCFGGWVPKAKACGGCPLVASCKLAAAATLHQMMVDAAAAAPVPEGEEVQEGEAQVVEPEAQAPSSKEHTLVYLPITCFCSACENTIEAGAQAVTLEEGGVYHPKCAP